MYPKWIVNILRFYHLYGFYMIQTEKSISFIVLLVHIILCFFASVVALAAIIGDHSFFENLDVVNFLSYYVASVITYWLIIYDSFANRSLQFKFWNLFDRMNQNYGKSMKMKKGAYLTGCIALSLIDTIAFGLFFCDDTIPTFNKILHFFFLGVFDNRIFYYILHLKLIASKLQKIEIQMKHHQGSWTEKQFKLISNQYRLTYEMSDCVNMAFSWSQVALVMLTFYTSVTYLNIVYRLAHAKFNRLAAGMTFISITQKLF